MTLMCEDFVAEWLWVESDGFLVEMLSKGFKNEIAMQDRTELKMKLRGSNPDAK